MALRSTIHPLLRDVSYSLWKQVQGRGFYDLLTACNATNEHVASAIAQTSTTNNATQFLALLKQSYEGIGRVSKHHAISKANQLTMADTSVESVRKFCTSFQDLINIVHEDKEAPLGSQLYDALCRKIPSHLISKDSLYDEYQDGSPKFPTSRKIMAQLQRVAQDMEHESFNTGIKPKVHVATSATSKTSKCLKCGGKGHTAAECHSRGPYRGRGLGFRGRGNRGGRGGQRWQQSSTTRTPPKSHDIVCYRCGGKGHVQRNCPSSTDIRFCTHCQRPGHTIENCRFRPQANFLDSVRQAVQETLNNQSVPTSAPQPASNVSVNNAQAQIDGQRINQFFASPAQPTNPFYAFPAHAMMACPIASAFTAAELNTLEANGCVVYIFDTGATHSVAPGTKSMHSLRSISGTISGVGAIPIIGTGVLQLHLPQQLHANSSLHDIMTNTAGDATLNIPDVLVAPAIRTKRLLAASSLHDSGYYTHTDVRTGRCYLQHRHSGHVIPLVYRNGLSFIVARYQQPVALSIVNGHMPDIPKLTDCEAYYLASRHLLHDADLWHQRCGHCSHRSLHRLRTLALGAPRLTTTQELSFCPSCAAATHARTPVPRIRLTRAVRPFDVV